MIKQRFPPATATRLQAIAWWDWPFEVIMARLEDFQQEDITAFCDKWSG
jgi:hypothetical protein